MEAVDRKKINNNRVLLMKDLIIDPMFLAQLQEMETLNVHRVDDIEACKTKIDKTAKFLEILEIRGPKAFENFISALVNTEQSHLAEALDRDLVAQLNLEKENGQSDAMASTLEFGKITELPDSEDEVDQMPQYNMTASPRGRAIILNNKIFEPTKLENRMGSDVDVKNLTDLLNYLDFEVVEWIDCTAKDIKRKIEDERQDEYHRDKDALILIAMSHGMQDVIFGTDGNKLDIEKDIIAAFDGQQCPHLINKPKLFFLQCCRGDKVAKGFQFDAAKIPSLASNNETEKPEEHAEECGLKLHEKADVLVVYSTVTGYAASRDRSKGSPFIQILVKTMKDYSHKQDILRILTKVNNDLEEMEIPVQGHRYKQISHVNHTLRKAVFLVPKNSRKAAGWWTVLVNRGVDAITSIYRLSIRRTHNEA